MDFVRYKHARFSARFPAAFRYSPSHYWMAPAGDESGLWRVGFTKFATRMLGELVEAEWSAKKGERVTPGKEIGWVEGFKAASDVYCVMDGTFESGNPLLDEDACIVRSSTYIDGWLYAVRGQPESEATDVHGYIEILEKTINRMQEEEHAAE